MFIKKVLRAITVSAPILKYKNKNLIYLFFSIKKLSFCINWPFDKAKYAGLSIKKQPLFVSKLIFPKTVTNEFNSIPNSYSLKPTFIP